MGSGAQATPTPHQEGTSAASRPSDVAVTASHPDDTLLIVGGYTDIDLLAHTPCVKSRFDGGGNRLLDAGVHVLRLGGRDGALTHLSTNAIGPNVAFIARSPVNPDLLYASTERIDDEGEIITMRLTESFRLVETSRARAGGRSTCYLNFNRSKQWLMAVNYWDAKVSTVALCTKTGELSSSPRSILMRPEAAYVDEKKPTREEHWKYRQKWAHSHCAVTEPHFGLVHFVVDLGLDRIFAYRVDKTTGALVQKGVITLPKGKGPRHLAFHPTRRAAYLVNELDSTVSCFKVNTPARWTSGGAGVEETEEVSCLTRGAPLELVANLSSLPVEEQGKTTISPQGVWKAASHSSEIRVHPGGGFFVVGNRGHDSVAVFRATDFFPDASSCSASEGGVPSSSSSGGIELVGITPSGGECPRNFNWAANGRFLVVGNQNSSAMCVFAFDRDTGRLSPEPVSRARVASPNYVFAAPLEESFSGARASRHTREDSVMSMQTQTIVVEDAVVEDAVSVPAEAVAAVAA